MSRWPAVPLAAGALAGLLVSGCGAPALSAAAARSPRAGPATTANAARAARRGGVPLRPHVRSAGPAGAVADTGDRRVHAFGEARPSARRKPGSPEGLGHGRLVRQGAPARAARPRGHPRTRGLQDGPGGLLPAARAAAGDTVRVGLADGRILVFRVQRVQRYPKDEFPTEAVYFPTLNRELRLITCGGEFDYAAGSYRDNIVVYATLAS
jgi:Sortase family.